MLRRELCLQVLSSSSHSEWICHPSNKGCWSAVTRSTWLASELHLGRGLDLDLSIDRTCLHIDRMSSQNPEIFKETNCKSSAIPSQSLRCFAIKFTSQYKTSYDIELLQKCT